MDTLVIIWPVLCLLYFGVGFYSGRTWRWRIKLGRWTLLGDFENEREN